VPIHVEVIKDRTVVYVACAVRLVGLVKANKSIEMLERSWGGGVWWVGVGVATSGSAAVWAEIGRRNI
jgi:hypothetical protein